LADRREMAVRAILSHLDMERYLHFDIRHQIKLCIGKYRWIFDVMIASTAISWEIISRPGQ